MPDIGSAACVAAFSDLGPLHGVRLPRRAPMIWVLRIIAAGVMAGMAFLSGLIFAAARSDFVMRDCPDIPRAEWPWTADCSDGWFAQVAATVAGAVFLLGSWLIVRGLRK